MSLSSLYQPAPSWWVEVYISVPQQTYHLGPFNSREEARISRSAHVGALDHKVIRDITALVKQRQPHNLLAREPSCRIQGNVTRHPLIAVRSLF
jgi:Domain of unknown function (DUF1816)